MAVVRRLVGVVTRAHYEGGVLYASAKSGTLAEMTCVQCEKPGRATVTASDTGKSVKLCMSCFLALFSEATDSPEGPIQSEVFALIEKAPDGKALLRLLPR